MCWLKCKEKEKEVEVRNYECDCGAMYSHPDQIIACAQNNHGQQQYENETDYSHDPAVKTAKKIKRLRGINADLLAALKELTSDLQDQRDTKYRAAWMQNGKFVKVGEKLEIADLDSRLGELNALIAKAKGIKE